MIDEAKTLQVLNQDCEIKDYTFKSFLIKAKEKPPMKRIFGELFQTGELCLLAGKTGTGKSILAYQIADGISRGIDILGLPNDNPPTKVLYYDFELSEGHIQKRFSNYTPSENFFRPDMKAMMLETEGKFDFDIVEQDIDETGSKVIIIDNITAIALRSTQDQDEAMNLMKKAMMLKQRKDVSILLIAHTTKKKENTPLELYDIAGAGHIFNFIDNAFMVGKSKNAGQRYIKQVKNRNNSDIEDVMTVMIMEEDWLHYEFLGYDNEATHLPKNDEDKGKRRKLMEIADTVLTEPLQFAEFISKYSDIYGLSKEAGKKKLSELSKNNIIIKDYNGKWVINQNEKEQTF